MSRNRETKRVNQQSNAELERLNREYEDYRRSRETEAGAARKRSDDVFNEAMTRYRNFGDASRNRRPVDNEALSHFRRFAQGGGIDDENVRRMRGGGVFDEFARTGGLSEEDKGLYRARGTASIPSFYENLRNEMGRQAAIQGKNVGFDAQMALSAREQSKAAQEAATAAEADILDRVTSGRQWGASSMSDAERAVADALQRGRMFGVEGLERESQFGREDDYRNRALDLSAIEGMRGLRADAPGEVGMYEQAILNSMGQGANARGNMIGQRMAYNPNKSFLERMGPLINAGVGAAGAFLPGGGLAGSLRNRRNRGVRLPTSPGQPVQYGQRYGD